MSARTSLILMLVFPAYIVCYSTTDTFVETESTQSCPNIITREQWGARAPKSIVDIEHPIPYVVIQHSVTSECLTEAKCASRMASMQHYHMETRHWDDIAYSFAIGGDGNVYEGTGWERVGTHTLGYNQKAIGIGFIGNFEEKEASNLMLNTAHQLILCGKAQGYLKDDVRVIGARQVTATNSPGYKLFRQIQAWPEWVAYP